MVLLILTITLLSFGFLASAVDVICPPNCSSGSCDSNGKCKSCKDSFWGPTCAETCPLNCQYSRCSMMDGTCSACKGGGTFWGPKCENPCPANCSPGGQCKFSDGTCSSCKGGGVFWGPTCENPCPPHCFPGGQCKFKDGTCSSCSTPNWEHMPYCDLPGGCLTPKGTDCKYYDKCLDSLQECSEVSSIMKPKCNEYLALESKLSKNGTAWSKTTRQCIQKKISDKVLSVQGSYFSCDDVSSTFFGEHVDCYLNGGAVSFCSLSPLDKLTIFAHGASIFYSDPKRIWTVLSTGAQLQSSCSNQQLYSDVFGSSPELWDSLEAEIKKQALMRGWDYASQANAFAEFAQHSRTMDDSSVDMQLGFFGTDGSSLVSAESVKEAVLEALKAITVPSDSVLLYNGVSLL